MDDEQPLHRVTAIEPIDCLKKSKDLIGDQYWLFVAISAVAYLILTAVPFYLLMGPMMCGLSLCFRARERGEEVRFELLFKGFEHFVQSLIASMVQLMVILAVTLPFVLWIGLGVIGVQVAMNERLEGLGVGLIALTGTGCLGLLAIWLIVMVFFSLTFQLVVDRGLPGIEAVKAGARAAKANIGGLTGLTLLNALIGLVATMMCALPFFLALPILFGANWVAYRKIFPAPAGTVDAA